MASPEKRRYGPFYTYLGCTPFTYRDEGSGEPRVGYYDVRHGRLTVLTDDEAAIVTHFPCPEHYVRRQPASDYRR
jgi:hypothetical protein